MQDNAHHHNNSKDSGVSLLDIILYIQQYRKNKVFRGWNIATIISKFREAIKQNACLVDYNNGLITGVILCKKDVTHKVMHVNHCLTTSPQALKNFVKWFMVIYGNDGWTLTGTRRGKLKTYNTKRLCHKILN